MTHPEPEYSPDNPRYPEIEIELLGRDPEILSIVHRVRRKMRHEGLSAETIGVFFDAVTSKPYDAALHEVLCWVSVAVPDDGDDG